MSFPCIGVFGISCDVRNNPQPYRRCRGCFDKVQDAINYGTCSGCSQSFLMYNLKTGQLYNRCRKCSSSSNQNPPRHVAEITQISTRLSHPSIRQHSARCPGVFGNACGAIFSTRNATNTRVFRRCLNCNRSASNQSNYGPCRDCGKSFYRFNVWTGAEFNSCRDCVRSAPPVDPAVAPATATEH